jgi:hypothetical protein
MPEEHWEKTTAEAIVADLYMNQGLGGEPQFAAPAYRRRLVVQIAGLLGERVNPEIAAWQQRLEDLRTASPFVDGIDLMRERAVKAEHWIEKARAFIRQGKTGLSHPDEYRALLGPRGD